MEIATREEEEFMCPAVTIVPVNEEEEKKKYIHIVPDESDAEAMVRFARENPQYV